jgi:hypothetical protein
MKKKIKKYAGGGLSEIADSAQNLMQDVEGMANTINYGSSSSSGSSQPLGIFAVNNMKKGGAVKKMKQGGYVKSADGCAVRGKTKGRMI